MTRKQELIDSYKSENPILFKGEDDELKQLLPAEYEQELSRWADGVIAEEESLAKKEADKAALLAKLGITADEAKLLLS